MGFSLIEMLFVLALIALLSVLALPNYEIFVVKAETQTMSSQLLRAINLAHSEAQRRGKTISVCGSANLQTCDSEWAKGQIVFVDGKEDGNISDKAQVIYIFNTKAAEAHLFWRSALNRHYLQFHPGTFTSENVTFWYCRNQEKTPRWAIVINQAARARLVENGKELQELICLS